MSVNYPQQNLFFGQLLRLLGENLGVEFIHGRLQRLKNAEFPNIFLNWDFANVPVKRPRRANLFSIYGTNDE